MVSNELTIGSGDVPPICQVKLEEGDIMSLEAFENLAFPLGGSLEQFQDGVSASYEGGFYDLDYGITEMGSIKKCLEKFRSEYPGFHGSVGTEEKKYRVSIEPIISGNKINWVVLKRRE